MKVTLRKLEEDKGETQFRFKNDLGIKKALFSLNVLVKKILKVNNHGLLSKYFGHE